MVEVRDSAGVRIVDNRARGFLPVFAELDEHDLELGALDGEPAYLLSDVIDVRGLDDGGFVLAERQSGEVRVFDAQGLHVRSLGREGDGPGEFAQLGPFAGVRADTVWAWDPRARRVSTFLLDGRLLSTTSVGADAQSALDVAYRLPDASYLVEAPGSLGSLPDPGSGMRPRTAPLDLLRYDSAGELLDTVAALAGHEVVVGPADLGDGRTLLAAVPSPFQQRTWVAVGGGRIYAGRNTEFRISVFELQGSLRAAFMARDLERPFEPPELEALRSWWLERCDGGEVCLRVNQQALDTDPPAIRPPFTSLRVSAEGNLWAAEYETVPSAIAGWLVFSPDGELLGRVPTPPGLDIYEIRSGYVVGVISDDLGVPYVRRYPLTRLRS